MLNDPDASTSEAVTAAGPTTVVGAIRGGTLDPELAGLLWVLLEGGVPLVVAGEGEGGLDRRRRATVLDALLDLVPAGRSRRRLGDPTDDLVWLVDAERLGWRRPSTEAGEPGHATRSPGTAASDPAPEVALQEDPGTTILCPGELGGTEPGDAPGELARVAIRALGLGYSMAATVRASRLEAALDALRRRPVFATDDELSRLGVVLVLEPGLSARVAAAHYLRPLARDVHGHPQRLPPAVLATWDGGLGRFEHFAWGVATELATRTGRKVGDFEIEVDRRSAALADLVARAGDGPGDGGRPDATATRRDPLQSTLEGIRLGGSATPDGHRH